MTRSQCMHWLWIYLNILNWTRLQTSLPIAKTTWAESRCVRTEHKDTNTQVTGKWDQQDWVAQRNKESASGYLGFSDGGKAPSIPTSWRICPGNANFLTESQTLLTHLPPKYIKQVSSAFDREQEVIQRFSETPQIRKNWLLSVVNYDRDIRMGLTVTAVLLQMNYYLKKETNKRTSLVTQS